MPSFDALMCNMEGFISECTVSNVFFMKEGELKTPSVDCGILEGVTRELVIKLAREQAMSVHEGRYTVEELLEADECFLTNTSMEIMPVRQVERGPDREYMPGPINERASSTLSGKRGSIPHPSSSRHRFFSRQGLRVIRLGWKERGIDRCPRAVRFDCEFSNSGRIGMGSRLESGRPNYCVSRGLPLRYTGLPESSF